MIRSSPDYRNNLTIPPVGVFITLVFVLSWPILIYGFGWFATSENIFTRYLLSCTGMMMVALSAFLTRVFVEHKGFSDVGWNLGRFRWYLTVLCFCLLMWISPVLIALISGKLEWNHTLNKNEVTIVILSLGGFSLIAGFGEEFGWRGYLLSRLLSRHTGIHLGVLVVGFIWGIWHCAVAISPLLKAFLGGTSDWLILIGPTLLRCLQMVASSVALSFIFGAIWLSSKSIFLSSFFHGYWIGIRDSTSHLFTYPSEYQLVTLIFVLVAWFISNSWLHKHETSVNVDEKYMWKRTMRNNIPHP